MNWTALLDEHRQQRSRLAQKPEDTTPDDNGSSAADWQALYQSARPHFLEVEAQLSRYLDCLSAYPNDTSTARKSEKMQLIKDTRNSLRFGLSCLSVPSESVRTVAQDSALLDYHWDDCLLQILCSDRGDAKCRLLSAQLLSNLVTSNATTAAAVSTRIALAPSHQSISLQLQATLVTSQQQQQEQGLLRSTPMPPNWVDAMLKASKSGNRSAMGAVVAALHNCLLSLQKEPSSSTCFSDQVSSCSLLISTLLRQVVPANKKSIGVPAEQSNDTSHDNDSSADDSATEWIVLFLTKLVRLGALPNMYKAITGKGDVEKANDNDTMSSLTRILPEHVVLLHLIRGEVERHASTANTAEEEAKTYSSSLGERGLLLLGGGVSNKSDSCEGVEATHLFLSRLVATLLEAQHQRTAETSSARDAVSMAHDDDDDQALHQSAILAILDILAETLADDTPMAARVRNAVGRKSPLMSMICQELGRLLDTIAVRNHGRKSRNVELLENEQARLTVLVRVLGNLAFGCPYNQDLLRTTRVPVSFATVTTTNNSSPSTNEVVRTGLHVLLSCTLYSHVCFTLREWAVVAIRNALHENVANQQVVERLEAQHAVQSAELNDMGIRIDLNNRGQVSVAPLDDAGSGEGSS